MDVGEITHERLITSPSPLKGCHRSSFVVKHRKRETRYLWRVGGEEGSVIFQAGPVVPPDRADLIEELTKYDVYKGANIDGIPWMGWDLGVHSYTCDVNFETVEGHYRGHFDPCGLHKDTSERCCYDGSSLAAYITLKAWIKAKMNDEIIYLTLEEWYSSHFLSGAK